MQSHPQLAETAMLERPKLSPRQREALSGVALGKSRAQIAREMGISTHTLKSYMYVVFKRLGARNAPEAVAIALRMDILEGGEAGRPTGPLPDIHLPLRGKAVRCPGCGELKVEELVHCTKCGTFCSARRSVSPLLERKDHGKRKRN